MRFRRLQHGQEALARRRLAMAHTPRAVLVLAAILGYLLFMISTLCRTTLLSQSPTQSLLGVDLQSNALEFDNVQFIGVNVNFFYCSIVPRVAVVTVIPNAAWPCASAGLQITTASSNYSSYVIGGNSGYQFGINIPNANTGPMLFDHGDIWGFGNAISWSQPTTAAFTFSDTWIHDSPNAQPQGYHTDGPGYLNGGAPPSNISIIHCTIAMLGTTNNIAFQASTSPYTNYTITNNYFAGNHNMLALGTRNTGAPNSNWTFTGNVVGTDVPWEVQILDDIGGPNALVAMSTRRVKK